MPDTQTTPKNRKERREVQRNAAPARTNTPRPRRKAEDIINSLPAPWAGKVFELSTDLTARKRLALLALRGEYGYKVLLFVRINAIRTTQTEAGLVEAVEAFDILPADPVAAAAEANLLTEEVLEHLLEELADLSKLQTAWVRPEQRPLTQRPFAALAGARPAAPATVSAPPPEKAAPTPTAEQLHAVPAAPTVIAPRADGSAWWWASACC